MALVKNWNGSWGTPDLGLTEWYQKTFMPGTTGTGQNSSDIFPNNPQPGQSLSDPTLNTIWNDAVQLIPQTTTSGGGTGGGAITTTNTTPTQPTYQEPQQTVDDQYSALRSDISSSWDNYLSSLDQQIGGLNEQRAAQENIAGNTYGSGVSTAGLAKDQGVQQLQGYRQEADYNQMKSLRDLSGNMRQAFMTGNNLLGARGASDSSATKQYALALAKETGRQRGDIMQTTSKIQSDINLRESNLMSAYNDNLKQLDFQRSNQLNNIAMWFSQQQNAIRQAQSQGQLSKSQDLQALSKDILNQSIAAMNLVNQQNATQKSQLDAWALGISKNMEELKKNWAGVSTMQNNLPVAQAVAGTPQIDSFGNVRTAFNYNNSLTEEEKRRRLLSGQA